MGEFDFGKKYVILEKELKKHVEDKSNSHNVTKAQVGLGKVENYSPEELPLENNPTIKALDDKIEAVSNIANVKSSNWGLSRTDRWSYYKSKFNIFLCIFAILYR